MTYYDEQYEDRNYNIAKALSVLRPGSQWAVEGNTYEGIIWHSAPETKPSKKEVQDEVARLKTEWENTEYQRKRAKEYPDIKQYLDGLVKGDAEQMQSYIDACLAVKAKYPKPAE